MNPLMRVKEESEKAGLKLSIKKKKLRSCHLLVSSLHGKQKRKKWKQWQILFPWTPESLQTVTAAMKLKDACSLEDVRVRRLTRLRAEELMLSNYGAGTDSWESLGLQGDQTSQSWKKLTLNIHWKDCWWSLSSNSLATWCEEPAHWKRPWCWGRLKAGGEGDDRRWVR